MDGQAKRVGELHTAVRSAMIQLAIADKAAELAQLQADSQQPDFWQDAEAAQRVMKQLASLEGQVASWQQLDHELTDLAELIALGDPDMMSELTRQLDQAQSTFDELKAALRFTGPYDDYNAILTIYAGAGGIDAQDWAGMLLRMYSRWAEQGDIKTELHPRHASGQDCRSARRRSESSAGGRSLGRWRRADAHHRTAPAACDFLCPSG